MEKKTSCGSLLLNKFFSKRKPSCICCSCTCHTHPTKSNNTSQLLDLKFFNCKCNHECRTMKQCKRCKKKKRRKKRIVKFQIQHTGSMNSLLASPNRCGCRPTDSGPGPMQRTPVINRTHSQLKESTRPKSLYEWTIPYENIEMGKVEAITPKGPVYRGRWHGDVMVYTRYHSTAQEIEDFHDEVALLGLIRHENIALFMGACIDTPNLAIVTSVRKGHTLYTHVHIRQTAFHFGPKFSIAKQIAQGMGYLHAKGITLGKLCSRNVFLESKVKIAITDYTMVNQPDVKEDYGSLPRGHLTYLSPELMRTLCKQGKYLTCSKKISEKSDVFAYGTLLFELFRGRYPFHGDLPEVVVWKTCHCNYEPLNHTDFPLIFKSLIESCWSGEAEKRPCFQDILTDMRKLNIPRSLQTKLSLSDSGAINKELKLRQLSRLNVSPNQHIKWKGKQNSFG